MKLLTPTEIKAAKDVEIERDRQRVEAVRSALTAVQKDLNEAEARFDLKLEQQRIKWAKEEELHIVTIEGLRSEVRSLERARKDALFPIEEEAKKAHSMFIEAEKVLNQAKEKESKLNLQLGEVEDGYESLTEKLDELGERELNLNIKERELQVKELGLKEERENIKKLSQELSAKLQTL